MLARIAEVEARKLHIPAGHASMFSYCVHELHLSDQAAYKRIHVARLARRFPAIFPAIAEGRLHLTAAELLGPYLTEATCDELLAAATHQTKVEIGLLLARRFPRPDLPTFIASLSPQIPEPLVSSQLSPERVGTPEKELSPEGVGPLLPPPPPAPARVQASRVAPLAPERFGLQVTIGRATHDKLRHAQALLGPRILAGDIAQVLDRALDALIHQLERAKRHAATEARAR